MKTVEVTILGKSDCHLCDVAEEVIRDVAGSISETVEVRLNKRSILDDEALYSAHWERIPVIFVNGLEHSHWRVNPERLREAILKE